MQVLFVKNAFHPRKRSLYPDYEAGKVYDLADSDGTYYINKGLAVESPFSFKLPKIPKLDIDIDRIRELRYSPDQIPFTPKEETATLTAEQTKRLEDFKTAIDVLNCLKAEPNPSHEITLPLQPKLKRALKDGEISEEIREYFFGGGIKDITIKDIAGLYLSALNFSIAIKDDKLINRFLNELIELQKLTNLYIGYYAGQQPRRGKE